MSEEGPGGVLARVAQPSSSELEWQRETEQAIARLIEKEFLVWAGHSSAVNSLAFSPAGTLLVLLC